MGKKIAVYAGSFDPVTLGHLSIIDKASRLFDVLWVVVACNDSKKHRFSSTTRRMLVINSLKEIDLPVEKDREGLAKIYVYETHGLVSTYAKENNANFLIRGVRSIFDANEELQMAEINAVLQPKIQTIFIPADKHLSGVSSSMLKSLAGYGADISNMCTKAVREALVGECNKI